VAAVFEEIAYNPQGGAPLLDRDPARCEEGLSPKLARQAHDRLPLADRRRAGQFAFCFGTDERNNVLIEARGPIVEIDRIACRPLAVTFWLVLRQSHTASRDMTTLMQRHLPAIMPDFDVVMVFAQPHRAPDQHRGHGISHLVDNDVIIIGRATDPLFG